MLCSSCFWVIFVLFLVLVSFCLFNCSCCFLFFVLGFFVFCFVLLLLLLLLLVVVVVVVVVLVLLLYDFVYLLFVCLFLFVCVCVCVCVVFCYCIGLFWEFCCCFDEYDMCLFIFIFFESWVAFNSFTLFFQIFLNNKLEYSIPRQLSSSDFKDILSRLDPTSKEHSLLESCYTKCNSDTVALSICADCDQTKLNSQCDRIDRLTAVFQKHMTESQAEKYLLSGKRN